MSYSSHVTLGKQPPLSVPDASLLGGAEPDGRQRQQVSTELGAASSHQQPQGLSLPRPGPLFLHRKTWGGWSPWLKVRGDDRLERETFPGYTRAGRAPFCLPGPLGWGSSGLQAWEAGVQLGAGCASPGIVPVGPRLRPGSPGLLSTRPPRASLSVCLSSGSEPRTHLAASSTQGNEGRGAQALVVPGFQSKASSGALGRQGPPGGRGKRLTSSGACGFCKAVQAASAGCFLPVGR